MHISLSADDPTLIIVISAVAVAPVVAITVSFPLFCSCLMLLPLQLTCHLHTWYIFLFPPFPSLYALPLPPHFNDTPPSFLQTPTNSS
jgi:hypothetical protein